MEPYWQAARGRTPARQEHVGDVLWNSTVLWVGIVQPMFFHYLLAILSFSDIESSIDVTFTTALATMACGFFSAGRRRSLSFVVIASIWFPALLCAFDLYSKLNWYRPYGYAFDIAYRCGLPWAAGFTIHSAALSAAAALGFAVKRLSPRE